MEFIEEIDVLGVIVFVTSIKNEELCKNVLRNLFIQLLEACREASETGTGARPRPFVFSLDRVPACGFHWTERLAHVLGVTALISVKSSLSRTCQEFQHVVFSLFALESATFACSLLMFPLQSAAELALFDLQSHRLTFAFVSTWSPTLQWPARLHCPCLPESGSSSSVKVLSREHCRYEMSVRSAMTLYLIHSLLIASAFMAYNVAALDCRWRCLTAFLLHDLSERHVHAMLRLALVTSSPPDDAPPL